MLDIAVNSIIDHIPPWVWVTVAATAALAAFYFASPILIPLWRVTPNWVKVALAFTVAVVLAALGGRYKGRQNAEEEQRRRDAEAIQRRSEIDHDVQKLDRPAVDRRLDLWMRD